MSQGQRKLAAIMYTDMVGYTALGQKNESLSLLLVEQQRKLLRPVFKKHNGREIKTMGDAFLVEFSNALDAVRCAYDAQRVSREYNISQPPDQRIMLRIGLHLGDILESHGDIAGDTVNVASRIQSLADAGGVCVTRQVYDQVQNKFELPLMSLGNKTLRNVRAPLEVYAMLLPWQKEQQNTATELDLRRVAVLPFANMSPDPNDSYFADGITEEIISTLSAVSGLSVISRTSVMSYKGSTKKAKEIGHELEVGSILEGSFRKAGNKIRITTQLIAVNNDRHVWAQSYDRNLDDVFAVQTDIAKQVSDALRVRILAPEMDRIDKMPTENTKAYALYLQGRSHWNKRGVEDIRKASEFFKQSIVEDPHFALGYVGIADCDLILEYNWNLETEGGRKRTKSMITQALEIDPELAEAHATKGLMHLHELNLRSAEEEFKKAIALKPSYASAHQWYSQLLFAESRWQESLEHIEKAVELDPLSPIINANHASFYDNTRYYAKALEIYKKTLEIDPNSSTAHFEMSGVYWKMNRHEDAKREAQVGIELLRGSFPQARRRVEAVTAHFGDDHEALRKRMPELEAHAGEPVSLGLTDVAGLYFHLGESEKGFEFLERALAKKEFNLLYLNTGEMFDGIRSDERYLSILKRLGLKPAPLVK
ncbi:MAG TPA: adenylate/guanylate cyclase domain-containing protein [Candidatus Dormibacteraeota bacterium]|nr:adenylate/guanylate cyclase domain-containing protein [Candidatus Dormibacteraeota bacterium]